MARRSSNRLAWLVLMVVGVGATDPNWAHAQSAADKATARQLATEGIQLFRQDRHADALDKLERAQSLFDAPVHLLYIARCQAKLNHLVEAAEAYRRLVRVELSAQAPQTFKDAIADGQKELPDIEPKVPSLRVEVTPPNVKDLILTIDGEVVSSAVVGVDRPINPGTHLIEVSIKGQTPVTRRVDVAVASKQIIKLELPAAGASRPTNSVAGDAPGTTGPEGATSVDQGTGGERKGEQTNPAATNAPRQLKLVAGVDLAGIFPIGGKIDKQVGTGDADDRSISGRYGPGAGLELRVGLAIPVSQFALTPLLFIGGNSHAPGKLYKASVDQSFNLDGAVNSVMTAEPVSVSIGLGLRFDTAPQNPLQLGGFGELGAVLRQAYSTAGTWTVTETASTQQCDFTEEFVGLGLRMRGGVMMPVSRLVTLVGGAGFTFANVNSAGVAKKSCSPILESRFNVASRAPVPADQRAIHAVFGLTLGAEFGFGL